MWPSYAFVLPSHHRSFARRITIAFAASIVRVLHRTVASGSRIDQVASIRTHVRARGFTSAAPRESLYRESVPWRLPARACPRACPRRCSCRDTSCRRHECMRMIVRECGIFARLAPANARAAQNRRRQRASSSLCSLPPVHVPYRYRSAAMLLRRRSHSGEIRSVRRSLRRGPSAPARRHTRRAGLR